MSSQNNSIGKIRIIKTPAGDAEEWVREAWLEVPELAHCEFSCPVDSGFDVPDKFEKVWPWRITVPCLVALDALAAVRPDAAGWWRNERPEVLREDKYFSFALDECKIISGMTRPTIRPMGLDVDGVGWQDA